MSSFSSFGLDTDLTWELPSCFWKFPKTFFVQFQAHIIQMHFEVAFSAFPMNATLSDLLHVLQELLSQLQFSCMLMILRMHQISKNQLISLKHLKRCQRMWSVLVDLLDWLSIFQLPSERIKRWLILVHTSRHYHSPSLNTCYTKWSYSFNAAMRVFTPLFTSATLPLSINSFN